MPNLPSPRVLNLVAGAACFALLGFAYYVQFGLGIEPCPLCVMQRIALIALGLTLLGAGIHGAIHGAMGRARWVWAALATLSAGAGVVIAAQHVWLQHLPPDLVPSCGPGLNYLVDVLPLFDAIKEAFQGSGECAVVNWTLLGLSMPELSLIWFIAFAIGAPWNALRKEPSRA